MPCSGLDSGQKYKQTSRVDSFCLKWRSNAATEDHYETIQAARGVCGFHGQSI